MESFRKMPLRGGNGRRRSDRKRTPRAFSAGSIAFWLLFAAAQCYLLRMFHESAVSNNGTTITKDGLERELILQRINEFKGGNGNGQHEQQPKPKPQPDGSFNGYPIYKLKNKQNQKQTDDGSLDDLYSQFHCVGEIWRTPELHKRSKTYHEQSWMYRSCRFEVFCFDTATKEFVIYLDPEKHVSSRDDHHYHNDVSDPKPHPSPHINSILEAQRRRISNEQKEVDDKNHERNETTKFKHPTFFDDTSTVYRNHTVVVDGTGKVVLGDTEQGKQYGVSIGSINAKWGLVDIQLLKWFPEVRWGPVPGSESGNAGNRDYDVYTLPSSVVMIPFHSLSAENPGHLVWDDLLPMHTILGMFGFLKKKYNESGINDSVDLLPMRYHLPGDERGLWASCDWLDSKRKSCNMMLGKFGTLMGTRRSYLKYHTDDNGDSHNITKRMLSAAKQPRVPITTNRDVELYLTSEGDHLWGTPPDQEPERKSIEHDTTRAGISVKNKDKDKDKDDDDDDDNGKGDTPKQRRRLGEEHQKSESSSKPKLICSRNGLAGFGAISDHVPMKGHGWERWDYEESHNYGRGGQLWEFRNYMIHNLFSSFPKTTPTTDIEKRWGLSQRKKSENQGPKSVTLTKEQLSTHPPHSITDLGPDEPLVVLLSAFSSQRRGGGMTVETKDLENAIREMGGSYPALYGRNATPGDIGAGVEIIPEIHQFSEFTIEAQIQMASRAAVLVTVCGGGAITAAFLPKGGGAQVYYSEYGGIENNRRTKLPARLDWDFFNNAGYLHPNWIPISQPGQRRANTELLLEQLRRIHGERIKEHQRRRQQQQQQ